MNLENFVAEASGSFIETFIRNAVAKKDREAIGDVIAKIVGNRYILVAGYPWEDAKTTPGKAYKEDHKGSESARNRIWKRDKQNRKRNPKRSAVRGQYHTQPYKDGEERGYISNDDKGFFREIMEKLELRRSVQIVASVRRSRHRGSTKNVITRSQREYGKKLRLTERIIYGFKAIPGKGYIEEYDMILATYLLTMKRCVEIPLKERRVIGVRLAPTDNDYC